MNTSRSAQTDHAKASLRRTSPTDATIQVSYRLPERRIDLEGNDLAAAVAALCDAEIQQTRQALTEVGDALAEQLSDAGTRPTLNRTWADDDERAWADRKDSIAVDAVSYASEETLSHDPAVSEAALVQEVIAQLIEQRRRAAENVYRGVLADLQEARAADRRP